MQKVRDIQAAAVRTGTDGKPPEKGKPMQHLPALKIGSQYLVMEKSQAQDVVDGLRKILKGMV